MDHPKTNKYNNYEEFFQVKKSKKIKGSPLSTKNINVDVKKIDVERQIFSDFSKSKQAKPKCKTG